MQGLNYLSGFVQFSFSLSTSSSVSVEQGEAGEGVQAESTCFC